MKWCEKLDYCFKVNCLHNASSKSPRKQISSIFWQFHCMDLEYLPCPTLVVSVQYVWSHLLQVTFYCVLIQARTIINSTIRENMGNLVFEHVPGDVQFKNTLYCTGPLGCWQVTCDKKSQTLIATLQMPLCFNKNYTLIQQCIFYIGFKMKLGSMFKVICMKQCHFTLQFFVTCMFFSHCF